MQPLSLVPRVAVLGKFHCTINAGCLRIMLALILSKNFSSGYLVNNRLVVWLDKLVCGHVLFTKYTHLRTFSCNFARSITRPENAESATVGVKLSSEVYRYPRD